MTDKEKIRAEVERLRESFKVLSVASPSRDTSLENIAKAALCKQILSFIDSLQKEPVSEDLEEAAKIYATEGDEISGLHIIDEEVEAFKAGAKWQKERIMENSTNATIGLPYENKYGGYTHLVDVSRPLPVGNNKIAIIFKED